MKKPLPRPPSPPMSAAQIVNELREGRVRAKAAPWSAACWLSVLALFAPFAPFCGMTAARAGADIFALVMLALAVVLFVRGAVARGVATLLFASLLCFWLSGGALLLVLALHARGIDLPWRIGL